MERSLAPRPLENVSRLLEHLGNPDRSYRSIQVAGTNGKGSVSAMLDSVLRAEGLRVGLFTSPSLTNVRERIRVDGEMIEERELSALTSRVLAEERRDRFSGFDRLTMCAALHFEQRRVDIAVFECGLGGRLDPTTALKRAVVALTRISCDHTQVLGGTLSQIAAEKACVLKSNIPAVLGPQVMEAADVIRAKAHEVGAPLFELTKESIVPLGSDLNGNVFSLSIARHVFDALHLPLIGEHQMENAAVAVQAAHLVYPVSEMSLRRGLMAAAWPCRLEMFPATGSRPAVLIDGAHNPDGARALANACKMLPTRPVLLFAARKDKDIPGMLHQLKDAVSKVIVTRCEGGATACELTDICASLEIEGEAADYDSALGNALKSTPETETLVIAGSLYFVGDMRERLIGLQYN